MPEGGSKKVRMSPFHNGQHIPTADPHPIVKWRAVPAPRMVLSHSGSRYAGVLT